jgi:YidC/Oxa1 family membrane protein insertase
MDRKTLIILGSAAALWILWFTLTNRFYPPVPRSTNALPSKAAFATNNRPGNSNLEETITPSFTSPSAPPSRAPLAQSRGREQIQTIEDRDARYTFTSSGGGLKSVELKAYAATIECRKQTAASAKQLATLNATAPTPIMAILGGEDVQGDGVFSLTNTPKGIRAEKVLTNGLRLVKDFEPSTNYLLKVSVRLENSSKQPISLPAQEWVLGTAAPMGLRDESMSLGLEWYNGSQAQRIDQSWFANRTLGCLPGSPRNYFTGGTSNVVWAAVQNQFFTVIAVPGKPAPEIVGRKVDLPKPTPEQLATGSRVNATPYGYETAFVYPQSVLAPGQAIERTFDVYAGPKDYTTLSRLGNDLDMVMGFGGFFGFFAKALLLSMRGLHLLMGLPYGLAIIVITVVIKLVFWPLTQASTRSMKRMQELQPQMKALQEKYKDDPRKMNMKLMEFMRENKVSPLGGCLPMLLQIPVFFGFYRMLQSAIELRGARFLWACDLSQPDTVWMIPGLNFPVNPLPLIMGVTMLWQARLTPASPGMDPVQQKMMKYMPLMFMFVLYNFMAGLTLYWTVQNLLTIAQMKLTKSSAKTGAPAVKPATPPARSAVSRKRK